MVTTRTRPAQLVAAVSAILDPEIPVVTIADLGILRAVDLDETTGEASVVITPTYSGCPAMAAIASHVEHVCRVNGWVPRVSSRLSPAWTTDWLSAEGREKLRRFGIAPPAPRHTGEEGTSVVVELARRVVSCPQCGSRDTTEVAHFGSTACKAMRRCESCREPFEEFKAL